MWSETQHTATETRTGRARREDILQAAIVVINRDGYAAASIDKIAAQAETTKSTVLYHFKSKNAINHALVQAVFAAGAEYMAPHIRASDTYRERLNAYITSNLRFIADHAKEVAALHQVIINTSPWDYENESVTWLQQMLAEGQARHEFGMFDPYVFAIAIRASIDNSSFYLLSNPHIDIAAYIAEVAQLFDKATQK